MNTKQSDDRRVRRTKTLLHRALASLLHEKSWDDIAVKEILGRADVGRSTFYAHYRDKDDLLGAALRETVATGRTKPAPPNDAAARVLAFSGPLLEHIEHIRDAHGIATDSERFASLHLRLQPAITDLISDVLRGVLADEISKPTVLPLDLVARQLASTFMLTLEWWIGQPRRIPAHRADETYLRLARPPLEAFLSHRGPDGIDKSL